MVPGTTPPASLLLVLQVTRPCFTEHWFEKFCHLAAGMVAQTGRRTVTGMLTGAGLSRLWPHRRAHAFFSRASWDPDRLGLRLARAVVEALLPVDAPVPAVIYDSAAGALSVYQDGHSGAATCGVAPSFSPYCGTSRLRIDGRHCSVAVPPPHRGGLR
ncbi:transposase [Streptomyces sp. M2CJ-2]|uniref:transposase n=1 Tax=Streptomyces sp. M2CJ-2 TaxID=2803948 RepID=UPI00192587B1|nr:transposase [Streptomyces sp. M2CJ-2]MBL3670551.1 transposase [Streptomyces sp. M2CJ-2]